MDNNLNFNLLNNHPNIGQRPYNYGWGNPVVEQDDDLLHRLCDYFQQRKNESLDGDSSIWNMNVSRHSEIIRDLESRNMKKLHDTFRFLFASPLAHGFCGGDVTNERLIHSEQLRNDTGFLFFDKLISLAEIVGAIKVFDPGEYAYVKTFNKFLSTTPDEIISRINKVCNVDITAPRFSGKMFGLVTNYGVYSERDINAIALALHIRGLTKNNDIKICDIGGGAGHLAYYLHKVGFKDISIVDLPTVSLVQMYFTETNIGKNHIKLLAPSDFDGDFDIVTNMDSMIEMNVSVATNYINKMKNKTKRFISINTEKMTNDFDVKDICDLKKISRNMSYLNRGYVIEEYTGV